MAGRATVGAGGAIVVDSDPEEELEEMLLKAQASISAFEYRAPLWPELKPLLQSWTNVQVKKYDIRTFFPVTRP